MVILSILYRLSSFISQTLSHHAGGYGPFEPDSQDLLTYLTRLEEQQRVVIGMMSQLAAGGGSPAKSLHALPTLAPIPAVAYRRSPPHSVSSQTRPERRRSSLGRGLPPIAPHTLSTVASRATSKQEVAAEEGVIESAAHMWHPAVLGSHHMGVTHP